MPEIITRKEALEKKLSRYFTGKPCKYGHVCERFSSNNNCLICKNEKLKKYQKSEKGKKILKSYLQSEKGRTALKKSQKKYFQSEKGIAALKRGQRKYFNSEKGKEKMKNAVRKGVKKYLQTEKGKAVKKKANKKYQQSEKGKKWIKNKLENDPSFKMASRQRMRIADLLSKKGIHKKGKTLRLIGCSAKFLSDYIESKFKPGMNWNNYGIYGWHVDHIKPLSKFDLEDPDQQKIAFHYTNLQPLWANENIKKSNKY